MMTTFLPSGLTLRKLNLLFIAILLLAFSAAQAQSFKGKDGAETYTTAGTYILNRYATLAASAHSGALSVTVSDINELNGAHTFTNAVNPYASNPLSRGDMVLIIQLQGADISTADDASYGTITNYNNAGHYELKTVYDVSANTIFLCDNLANAYTQSGRSRTQVIRVPRLTSLTVGTGVTLTGLAWNGAYGGVVAIEANNTITVNGTISANALGFRGGTDDINTSSASGAAVITLYRTTATNNAAGKGESIAGNTADYNTYLNGSNGRGAPANGGGGGNGHNSGGGGGANAGTNGVLTPWNGTGLKNISTAAWATAWNFESAGFSTNVSTGAGRGGYSFSNSNQDALVSGPGAASWGGDKRQIVGGFGGRPLDYSGNNRLFMGGGGGAGDGNNASAGNAGNGGGIVYLLTNNTISGSGTITANGQNGYPTQSANIDAAGGGGGGGAIVAIAKNGITGVSMQANGGKGGDQLYLAGEAEGPGGGGGGGFIATTATTISKQINGGANGITNSAQMTEFLPNGATEGAGGTSVARTFTDVYACNQNGFILPVNLLSFEAVLHASTVSLNWSAESEIKFSHFETERSFDGRNFSRIATTPAKGSVGVTIAYTGTDDIAGITQPVVYYRLKMVDKDHNFVYSATRIIRTSTAAVGINLAAYPNPVINELRISIPAGWQGKKVAFSIYDVSGKLALSFEKKSASQTETADMSKLGNGLYLVQASMNGQVAQERIMKR